MSGNCSSFDRASRYDAESDRYIDWGANVDGSGVIRMEGADSVVAELEGPGVIWRIWSAMPREGHLQFYIDGGESPALDVPFAEYFNNRSGMFAYPELVRELSRGLNSYIPISYKESCKVVLCEGWGQFYQISYTQFAPGTEVPSFAGEFDSEMQAALSEADAVLGSRLSRPIGHPVDLSGSENHAALSAGITIPAGQSVCICDLDGPGAISDLWIKVHFDRADPVEALRDLTIAMWWDHEDVPSVWAPLGDFFGSGPGHNRYRGLPMGMTQDGYYSSWYMPFSSGARISIGNDGKNDRSLEYAVHHEPPTKNPDQLLRFHAKWHQDAYQGLDAERYQNGDRYPDWPFLNATGPGRFCGVNLQVWNPNPFGEHPEQTGAGMSRYGEFVRRYFDALTRSWWGEGDEKFFVDGEKFPSTFGTGSEDYFGYAWAAFYPLEFESAFQNLSLCPSRCEGHVSQNRFHIADNVPFQRSFEGCLEKYHPNEWPLLYSCTPYWYQKAGEQDLYSLIDRIQRQPASVDPTPKLT